MNPALANALLALPTGGFATDLARAVTNDRSVEGGNTWLLTQAARYLESRKLPHGWIAACDHLIDDAEALELIWPAFRRSALEFDGDPLPAVARYLVERLPVIWDGASWRPSLAPVTRALVLADNIDTMVGFFSIDIKPTGSKDPYALRRAAITILRHVLFPIMRVAA